MADSALTPKDIAEKMLVTRGNVTGVLKRLHEQGLIRMVPHATDGRSFLCELTSSAKKLLARVQTAAAEFVQAQLSPFDDKTLQNTERQMNQMFTHLRSLDPLKIASTAK